MYVYHLLTKYSDVSVLMKTSMNILVDVSSNTLSKAMFLIEVSKQQQQHFHAVGEDNYHCKVAQML